MARLKEKDLIFAQEYAKGKTQKESALIAYPNITEKSAGVIGSNKAQVPAIAKKIQSLADRIPNDLLVRKHKALLNKKEIAYFVFSNAMQDDEIKEHLALNGLDCINIKQTEKGKYAYYTTDDTNAVSKGLDMAYKLKSLYAEDNKPQGGTVNIVSFRKDDEPIVVPVIDVTPDKTITK